MLSCLMTRVLIGLSLVYNANCPLDLTPFFLAFQALRLRSSLPLHVDTRHDSEVTSAKMSQNDQVLPKLWSVTAFKAIALQACP